jgi:hypothetical protein
MLFPTELDFASFDAAGSLYLGCSRTRLVTPLVMYAPGKCLVRMYHRLEVYVVEAETRAHVRLPAVRLLAVVARMEDGSVACLGIRYDRGFLGDNYDVR